MKLSFRVTSETAIYTDLRRIVANFVLRENAN